MLTFAALLLVATPTDPALVRYLDTGAGNPDALVASLRAQGQAGLDLVVGAIAVDPQGLPLSPGSNARSDRALALVDRVAGQKDAAYTKVFWHTSLADALQEAKRTHKPVLSLRLLGHLDDTYSCANSRYFRSLVYPDPAVQKLLRERFVLHWQSVRPAPKVTIDMGDGRTLTSTVTGNSAHIIMDADGAVVDALPGLYDAPAFVRALEDALALVDARDRKATHGARIAALDKAWPALAARAGMPGAAAPPVPVRDGSALNAAPLAMAKAMPERPFLKKLTGERLSPELDPLFMALGRVDGASLTLSPGAQAIFRTQLAPGVNAGAALQKTLAAMAADSAQNEQVLHRRIHAWLKDGAVDAMSLQERMYSELFLTASDDPWIGLVTPDSYTGVAHGGVR